MLVFGQPFWHTAGVKNQKNLLFLQKQLFSVLDQAPELDLQDKRRVILYVSASIISGQISGPLAHRDHLNILDSNGLCVVPEKITQELKALLNPFLLNLSPWDQLTCLSLLSEILSSQNKRKSQGVFYTPSDLALYLADQVLDLAWYKMPPGFPCYDPACGSGLFLWALLLKIKQRLELHSSPQEVFQHLKQWLNSFFGSDLDELALDICFFGFWLLWQDWYPGTTMPTPQLRVQDALAGTSSSFEVQACFPELSKCPGVYLSNPPYLGEKNNLELFQQLRVGPMHALYQGRTDLYYYFFYLAQFIMAPGSVAGLLTPNYFYAATAGATLRRFLSQKTQLLKIMDFLDLKVFPEAPGQHNQFIIFQTHSPEPEEMVSVLRSQARGTLHLSNSTVPENALDFTLQKRHQSDLFHGPQHVLAWSESRLLDEILDLMQACPNRLEDHYEVHQGIVTGADRLSKGASQKFSIEAPVGAGIFVLNQTEAAPFLAVKSLKKFLKPWYKNSDIYPFKTSTNPQKWLINAERDLKALPEPLLKHLEPFRPILAQRREVRDKRIAWWQLQWPRKASLFQSQGIVLPQRARVIRAAYIQQNWYASADVYYIQANHSEANLWALLVLLNSPLYTLWLYHFGKRKGNYLELYYQPLTELPLPQGNEYWLRLAQLGQSIFSQSTTQWLEQVHQMVSDCFCLSPAQRKRVQHFYLTHQSTSSQVKAV